MSPPNQISQISPFAAPERKACFHCSVSNPSLAKFCKSCGKTFSTGSQGAATRTPPSQPDEMVIVPPFFSKEVEEMTNLVALKPDNPQELLSRTGTHHFLFLGNTGTGKSLTARALATKFKELGLLTRGHVVELSESQCGGNIRQFLDSAKGGLLVIEQVHLSLKKDQPPPNYLLELCSFIDRRAADLCIVLMGFRDEVLDAWNSGTYANIRARFQAPWLFQDYSAEELKAIARRQFESENIQIREDALEKIAGLVVQERRKQRQSFSNAWFIVRDLFNAALQSLGRRRRLQGETALAEILPEDIPGQIEHLKTVDEVLLSLDGLVGMVGIREFVEKISKAMQIQRERSAVSDEVKQNISGLHLVLTGNPGTGKTTVARILGEVFRSAGYLASGHVVEVERSKLVAQYVGQTAHLVHKRCDEALDGVLFIDEAYTLASREAGQDDAFGREAIETLMKRMEDDRGRFIVVVAGYKEEMERFLAANDGLRSRFTEKLHIPDYSAEELAEIFERLVKTQKLNMSEDCERQVRKVMANIVATKDRKFGNARTVRSLFEETLRRQADRLSSLQGDNRLAALQTIERSDLAYDLKEDQSPDEVLIELKKFVGMENIKLEVEKLLSHITISRMRQELGGEMEIPAYHILLTGNPGTGKTSLARILAKVFRSVGLLPTEKVVETDRSSLVGQYLGQTPKLVNEKIDSAMGGVLFIDEAYTLTPEGVNDMYGREAIEQLMKRMEDDKGKFVCIAAGYKKEMERFLDANPGLSRRFKNRWHIEDYSAQELETIFRSMVQRKNYIVAPDLDAILRQYMENLIAKKTKNFGNAGTIANLFETVKETQAARLQAIGRKPTREELFTLVSTDLVASAEQATIPISLEVSLAKLNDLVGLSGVKKSVSDLATLMEVNRARQRGQGTAPSIGAHFVFTGNPGTGKTTVARILGEVLTSLGVLSKGHVVEVDRSKLVGQYVGQTEAITEQVINDAMGGMLFIDEAYTLAGQGNDFGKQAIDILLKRMEDDRGKFVVVVAGYESEMEKFLESNEGLRSRFTEYIHFDDYDTDEMTEIFVRLASTKGFCLTGAALQVIRETMAQACHEKSRGFANGRTVRNIFEKSLSKQANRLRALPGFPDLETQILSTIDASDISATHHER